MSGSSHARRASWGVLAPMYGAVTECRAAAMAEIGGDAWTAQMHDSWVEVLDAVAGLMMLGHPADTDLAS